MNQKIFLTFWVCLVGCLLWIAWLIGQCLKWKGLVEQQTRAQQLFTKQLRKMVDEGSAQEIAREVEVTDGEQERGSGDGG